jgi:ABC-type multidrug transport system ATPase subunit
MIEAQGLAKRYGSSPALAGSDLHAAGGSVLGVLGPNGAGRSTLSRVPTAPTTPGAGSHHVAGYDVPTAQEPAA